MTHTAAQERALDAQHARGHRIQVKAQAAAAAVAGAARRGQWGPVVDWPVVGVSRRAARRTARCSPTTRSATTRPRPTRCTTTRARPSGIRRPGRRRRCDVDTGYNVFCSGLAHLPDGTLFVAGGNKDPQLHGIVQTHVFNPVTEHVEPGPRHGRRALVSDGHRRCATARC